MGGWQTDRERAYVALTRAREQTNIYTSREDLGHQGLNTEAIDRLADRIEQSNAQRASITREPAHLAGERSPDQSMAPETERTVDAGVGPDAPQIGPDPVPPDTEQDLKADRDNDEDRSPDPPSNTAEQDNDHDLSFGIEELRPPPTSRACAARVRVSLGACRRSARGVLARWRALPASYPRPSAV